MRGDDIEALPPLEPSSGAKRTRVLDWLARCGWGIRTAWSVCGITLALLLCLEAAYRIQGAIRSTAASATRRPATHPYAGLPWFPTYEAELRKSFSMR